MIGKYRRWLPVVLVACLTTYAAIAQVSDLDMTNSADVRNLQALNISIAIFDPGVPTDASSHRRDEVFPQIREIEALLLPFVLREALVATSEWGAVRVVPEADTAAELLMSATITKSDGEMLELQLRVIDASGRTWIEQSFSAKWIPEQESNDLTPDVSGYQSLYAEIATGLASARAELNSKDLERIIEISFLRYVNQLAPSVFAGYLKSEPNGRYSIVRLPAENDPMLARIERIREVEYVFTDAVDKKFLELHAEIASTYELWRKYRRRYAEVQAAEEERLLNAKSSAPRGSYEEIQKRYDNYKWARVAAQEQEAWAVGFNNEVGPAIAAMETRVAELQGWVDAQYAEWGRLLTEIFTLETGIE